MSVDLSELLVKPVAEDGDTFAFQFDFIPQGKAVEDGSTASVVTELADGDLIIEGWAADFSGLDRQNENFMDGAFQRGIKSFLEGQAALCYHHKHDKVLGKVLDLNEVEGKGLRLRARVDGAIKNHPELGTIYEQIKKGTINALSVGGFFRRKLTEAGWRIADTDFTEISVTPVPVHPGTNFAVVAGKALEGAPVEEAQEEEAAGEELTPAIEAMKALEELVTRLEGKALPSAHNPAVASDLSRFLLKLGDVRQTATSLRVYGEEVKEIKTGSTKPEETLGALADSVETAIAKWEADAHKLAAQYGPLPPPPSGVDY